MSLKTKLGQSWSLLLRLAEANGDRGYADFVTKWPFSYYQKRVQKIGFVGLDRVLDVGCGNGQWMLALAAQNKHVTGVDPHAKRVATANALFENLWVTNAHAIEGNALQLEFPDASFDAVFCYGVFMFLDRQAALAEFHRVLRPEGKLYICTNGRGWWLRLAISNILKNRTLAKTAWAAFKFGRVRGMPNSTDLMDVDIFPAEQWLDIRAAAEGQLLLAGSGESIAPVYDAKYLGFDNVIEFVSTKRTIGGYGGDRVNSPAAFIDQKIEIGINAASYSYEAKLALYASQDQPDDAVNATNSFAVEHAVEVAKSCSRITVLQYIFAKITAGTEGDQAKLVACVTFAQNVFYHHFGLQPMVGRDRMLLDPVASLLFGACRCGNVARFLIDLLLVNGFQARLLGGSCHTSAEVFINGRWVLADASLFPPGVVPQAADGALLSLDAVANTPRTLDLWPSYINYNALHTNMFKQEYPRSYATIERWLRFPIPPSVAFFGKDFLGGGGGLVRRWAKNGDLSSWERDPDFGWYDLIELEGIQGLEVSTTQRPEQVQKLQRISDMLVWSPAEAVDGIDIEYTVAISKKSRGWSYSSIPVGFSFVLDAPLYRTSATQLKLDERFAAEPLYVTILAKDKAFPDAFVLPSVEFAV